MTLICMSNFTEVEVVVQKVLGVFNASVSDSTHGDVFIEVHLDAGWIWS